MIDLRTAMGDDDYTDGWVTPEEVTLDVITDRPRAHSKAIPIPTYDPSPDVTKKSHARKKPLGHIPRPRNAFILFRCDFVKQGNIPTSVESDHRNISRIVGRVWKAMSKKQKSPWLKMAEVEKANHRKAHPGYRPGMRNQKDKRGDSAEGDDEAEEPEGAPEWQPTDLPLQRALAEALQSFLDSQNDQSTSDGLNKASTSQDRDDPPPYQPYDSNSEADNPNFFEDIVNQHYNNNNNVNTTGPSGSEEITRSFPATSGVPEDANLNDVNGMFGSDFLHDIPVNSYPVPDFTVPPDWINMRYDPFMTSLPLNDNSVDLFAPPLLFPDGFASGGACQSLPEPAMPTFDPAYLDSISIQALEEQLQMTPGQIGEFNSGGSADFFKTSMFPFTEDFNGQGTDNGNDDFLSSFVRASSS